VASGRNEGHHAASVAESDVRPMTLDDRRGVDAQRKRSVSESRVAGES
jgi:hypothetical protein